MNAIEELASLVEQARVRKSDLAPFESAISELNVALGDVISLLEKPNTAQASAIGEAIRSGLANLSIPLNVSVQPTPVTVQPAQVNVQAPQVTVQSPSAPPTTWRLTVVSHFADGRMREILFKPEN